MSPTLSFGFVCGVFVPCWLIICSNFMVHFITVFVFAFASQHQHFRPSPVNPTYYSICAFRGWIFGYALLATHLTLLVIPSSSLLMVMVTFQFTSHTSRHLSEDSVQNISIYIAVCNTCILNSCFGVGGWGVEPSPAKVNAPRNLMTVMLLFLQSVPH